jgi:hypothetical protein
MTRRSAATTAGILAFLCVVALLTRAPEDSDGRPVAERDPRGTVEASPGPTAPAETAPIAVAPFEEPEVPEPTDGEAAHPVDETALEGVVLAPDGTPLPRARVAFFAGEAGAPVQHPLGTTQSGDEGRFRLVVPGTASTQGYLMGHHSGLRPGLLSVSVVPGRTAGGLELQIGAGLVVRGTVSLNGRPLDRAMVALDVAFGTGGIFPEGDQMTVWGRKDLDGGTSQCNELWWSEGRPEIKRISASTDPEGRFEMQGLSSLPYRLEVSSKKPFPSHADVFAAASQWVTPPATADVEIRTATVQVDLTGERGVEGPYAVEITSQGSGACWKGSTEEARSGVHVVPQVAHTLGVRLRGNEPARAEVPSLHAGEVHRITIELRRRDDPDLRLTVLGALASGIDRITARFLREGPPASSARWGHDGRREATLTVSRGRNDDFLIEDIPLPPGRYTVVVMPDGPSSPVLPSSVTVDLSDAGPAAAVVEVRIGGRYEITVTGADEKPVSWALRNANGNAVLSKTVHRGGGFSFMMELTEGARPPPSRRGRSCAAASPPP